MTPCPSCGDRAVRPLVTYLTLLSALLFAGCSAGFDLSGKKVNLAGPRGAERQYYRMETRIAVYGPDGKRLGTDQLILFLTGQATSKGEEYACRKFFVHKSGAAKVEIPDLANWQYVFGFTNERGDLLGIDRSKFQQVTGSDGKPLSFDMAYAVYNSFIDFHTFCNVFARETPQGQGIQDLKRVGQRIVHFAAFSEPPVDLGSSIKPGSSFKNGEITLELKGFSLVEGTECALVGFDSGESSFKMIMEPAPNIAVTTKGASHYQGDIYLDISSKWVKKATMSELVVSETIVPGMQETKFSRTVERSITITSVSREQFDTGTE